MSRHITITVEDTLPNGKFVGVSKTIPNGPFIFDTTKLHDQLDNRLWIEGTGDYCDYCKGPCLLFP